jgi:hypothetical protein
MIFFPFFLEISACIKVLSILPQKYKLSFNWIIKFVQKVLFKTMKKIVRAENINYTNDWEIIFEKKSINKIWEKEENYEVEDEKYHEE